MEKEEVLAMSRREKTDEGFIVAEHQGKRLGVAAFSAVLIFIVLFNLFTGQNNNIPLSLCWAFVAAEAYPKYTFTKKSSYRCGTQHRVFLAVRQNEQHQRQGLAEPSETDPQSFYGASSGTGLWFAPGLRRFFAVSRVP